MPAAVVNASPLIFLAKVERLEALGLFKPVYTTQVVLDEVRAGLELGHRETLAIEKELRLGRITLRAAAPVEGPELRLDPGEMSVIAVAQQLPAATVVIDDLAAIRAARQLGLRVRSTPFVLLDNVTEGRLESGQFRKALHALVEVGYHISPGLFVELLEEAGG